MASEKTFADIYGRGVKLNEGVKQFDPVFNPFDTSLATAAQDVFLNKVKDKNDEVNALRSDYTANMPIRIKLVKDLKNRSSLVRDFIESVVAYKPYWTALRNIVKKILNYKPPKTSNKLATTEADKKKRNRGEQSYADLANLLKALISLLEGIVGYAPTNVILTIAELTILYDALLAQNVAMSKRDTKLDVVVIERKELYLGAGGLKVRMKATKSAVRSQYGNTSKEYLSIKGIGYSK
jgi:hypothetical protein